MFLFFQIILFNFSKKIQVKIQKHATFEAEIQAHSYMMESIEKTGNEMVDDVHYASDFVQVKAFFFKYSHILYHVFFTHFSLCTHNLIFQISIF